uniref:Uncharacterized protein n=1 Tax=Lygus hesperus TaxID=30085 RepID=A0A0A9WIA2_LYGHE
MLSTSITRNASSVCEETKYWPSREKSIAIGLGSLSLVKKSAATYTGSSLVLVAFEHANEEEEEEENEEGGKPEETDEKRGDCCITTQMQNYPPSCCTIAIRE